MPSRRRAGLVTKQVVAHQLALVADLVGQRLPAVPVILAHAVLDRDDRVLALQFGEIRGHGFGLERAPLAFQLVLAVLEELGGGAIKRKMDILARPVAGLLDRLHDEIECVSVRS